jgi:hypothetical protein
MRRGLKPGAATAKMPVMATKLLATASLFHSISLVLLLVIVLVVAVLFAVTR